MSKESKTVDLDKVVIKFAGDSGDGMQLTGSQFTDTSAFLGNDLASRLGIRTGASKFILEE